jgi:hypothetical protein
MKLYTEEQLGQVWNTAHKYAHNIHKGDYRFMFFEDFIQELTPIELPSNEEIEERAYQQWGDDLKTSHQKTYAEGAKWMRDKIQGGNK